jgi:type II secretory pathway component PulJ
MLVVSILSVGALIAFFFYHRVIITRLEASMHNVVAELDYFDEVVQTIRGHITEMEANQIRRSKTIAIKKSSKKRGRPVNPNSIRQKKMKGGN